MDGHVVRHVDGEVGEFAVAFGVDRGGPVGGAGVAAELGVDGIGFENGLVDVAGGAVVAGEAGAFAQEGAGRGFVVERRAGGIDGGDAEIGEGEQVRRLRFGRSG